MKMSATDLRLVARNALFAAMHSNSTPQSTSDGYQEYHEFDHSDPEPNSLSDDITGEYTYVDQN